MSFFADTNICSKWETDPKVKKVWETTKADLEVKGHRYVVCPEVLIELLCRLIQAAPQFFSSDLKSFAFLNSHADTEFLAFPGASVLKAVLDIERPVQCGTL